MARMHHQNVWLLLSHFSLAFQARPSRTESLTMTAAIPPMPAAPANFDEFMPYNKAGAEKAGRLPPPKVDTAVASMLLSLLIS